MRARRRSAYLAGPAVGGRAIRGQGEGGQPGGGLAIRDRCVAGGEGREGRGKSPWPSHIICCDLDGSCAALDVWGRARP